MIKIASRWSGEGGSTESLIGLCNMFNHAGHAAVFYGPQTYHLDKCNAAPVEQFELESGDIYIGHYFELERRPACLMAVLSCHEKHTFPLRDKNISGYDAVRFVSKSQQAWQAYSGSSVVIPDNVACLNPVPITDENRNIAGVIGTILPAKQTHISIQRALADGVNKVKVFGSIGDQLYFEQQVQPLLSDNVVYLGHSEDRQDLYASISCVYHSSLSETYGLVKAECLQAQLEFHPTDSCDTEIDVLSDNDLLRLWAPFLRLEQS